MHVDWLFRFFVVRGKKEAGAIICASGQIVVRFMLITIVPLPKMKKVDFSIGLQDSHDRYRRIDAWSGVDAP